MQVDNVTIVWGLSLVFLAFIGVIISFMYFADKQGKSKRKKTSRK
jgi:hypothetical protein